MAERSLIALKTGFDSVDRQICNDDWEGGGKKGQNRRFSSAPMGGEIFRQDKIKAKCTIVCNAMAVIQLDR